MAVRFYESAAQTGYPPAEVELGIHYAKGDGVQQEYRKYIDWLKKAAEQDFAAAQTDLAQAYEEGRGVDKDLNKAHRLYALAAKNGSAVAANQLARTEVHARPQRNKPAQDLYREGKRLYDSGQREAAAKAFLAAAQAGNSDAQIFIAWDYLNGVGVSKSETEAAKWYRAAAEQGSAGAMWNLGLLYEKCQGVNEDWVEAAKWYRKSADLNNPTGQRMLGEAYQFGIGVPQSRQMAIQWHRRAQALGDGKAGWWAKTLSQEGPIGFRTPEERNMFFGLVFPGDLEPAGVVFHNSKERLAFVAEAASRYHPVASGPSVSSNKAHTYTDINGHEWDSKQEFDRICNPLHSGRPSQCPH